MEKNTLEKYLGFSLLLISVLIILILVGMGFQTMAEAYAELAFIAVGALASIGLKLLFFSRKSTLEESPMFQWSDVKLIRSAITTAIPDIPDFSYLTIHYSKRDDTADNPHLPYYVVNSKTKKAYWVRQELLVLNRRLIINSNTHDGIDRLKKYLADNDIELIQDNSKLGDLS